MGEINDPLILICAFRYALGRSTYVVSAVVDEIHSNWDKISDKQKDFFCKEILEHQRGNKSLGMKCDVLNWLSIVDRYNDEKFSVQS